MGKLRQLITFTTVIDENGFAAAGRKLGLTNAAVSKQITALEHDLGIALLRRTTRQLTLTEAGQIYYDHAKKLTADIRETESVLLDMKSEPQGHLKVGSSWHFAEKVLVPLLPQFFEKYPKLTIELSVMERIPDLAKEGIDINVGHTFVGGPDDIHRKIGETKYAYCASPEYLKAFGIPKKPEDLLKHRYLTHRMRKPDNVLTFRKGKEIRLEPFLRIDDSRTMIQCALQGIGIIKLHRYVIATQMEQGQLVEVLEGWDESVQPIYVCYQPQRYVQPKIRHFIDFFCTNLPKHIF